MRPRKIALEGLDVKDVSNLLRVGTNDLEELKSDLQLNRGKVKSLE